MKNTFAINIIPGNDAERLAVLERYRLLDTPEEKIFDNITVLAAATFRVPVALISLVGAETVFFKSAYGAGNVRCADRGESLCALAILRPDVLIYENTLEAPEIAGSIPVQHGVRFYAGAPLKTGDGYLIGTVCVAGFQPRQFGDDDRQVLEALSRVVMEQIELRLSAMTDAEIQARLLEQKNDFISVASHELKTPLTSLTATLQLMERLQGDARPEAIKKLLGQANRSLLKINSLVSDLLDVKRMGTGDLPLNLSIFPIGRLIEECCGHVRQQGDYHLLLEGDTELRVIADEQRIDQVMVNLVNNAIKYAPKSYDIHIRVTRETGMARIAVTDSGPGIPPQNLPRIFERYYRSGNHNVSGLGLGLYIISEIVRLHGGETGVESELGKGSTFWFTLPLAEQTSLSTPERLG